MLHTLPHCARPVLELLLKVIGPGCAQHLKPGGTKSVLVNKLNNFLVVAAAIGATGCSTPKMQTPSGRPEVTIQNTSVEKLKPRVINKMLDDKFTVVSSDPVNMQFDKSATWLSNMLLGSPYDARTWTRVVVRLVDQGNGSVRVVEEVYIVSNKGSAFERLTEVPAVYPEFQKGLEDSKARIESQAASP